MGKPKRAVLMIFVKLLLLLVPAIYIGQAISGALGIFIAIAAVNFSAGIVFHILNWRDCKTSCKE